MAKSFEGDINYGTASGYGQISPYKKAKVVDPEAKATQAAVTGTTVQSTQTTPPVQAAAPAPAPGTGQVAPVAANSYGGGLDASGVYRDANGEPIWTMTPGNPAYRDPGAGLPVAGGGGTRSTAGATGDPYAAVLGQLQLGTGGGIDAGQSGTILKQVLQQLLNKAATTGALGNVPFTGVR